VNGTFQTQGAMHCCVRSEIIEMVRVKMSAIEIMYYTGLLCPLNDLRYDD